MMRAWPLSGDEPLSADDQQLLSPTKSSMISLSELSLMISLGMLKKVERGESPASSDHK
jgi:hypothetical protein